MTLDREATLEVFRHEILRALDRAARQTFGVSNGDAGATDADLPRLFKALDTQVDTLAKRYNAQLTEG